MARTRCSGVSVVIPTYQRGSVLIETIGKLLHLRPPPAEILIVDQTIEHRPDVSRKLKDMHTDGVIRWLRLGRPSIPRSMNEGLRQASQPVVLFLDDDIIPDQNLIGAHTRAHFENGHNVVAGQVLQPGEEPLFEPMPAGSFRFCSGKSGFISEFMGGNFSIKRDLALHLGGFDENFVRVAYRFEADFAGRVLGAREKIYFEPRASIRHLKMLEGGTRSYGHHLRTIKPSHSVGEYYYLLNARARTSRFPEMLKRPFRAIATTHHVTHPWWIPVTLIAEALGFGWAFILHLRGPRLIPKQK
jgi:GT2 family glycosyltransferase